MANTMKYKGYSATIEYSAEDGLLIGSVIGIQDSLNFHGTTIPEITQAFYDSIDGYLDMCKRMDRCPDKPYKGSFNVRIPAELHRKAAIEAESNGMTLNQFVQRAIEKHIDPDSNERVIYVLPETTQNATVQAKGNRYAGARYKSTPSERIS